MTCLCFNESNSLASIFINNYNPSTYNQAKHTVGTWVLAIVI